MVFALHARKKVPPPPPPSLHLLTTTPLLLSLFKTLKERFFSFPLPHLMFPSQPRSQVPKTTAERQRLRIRALHAHRNKKQRSKTPDDVHATIPRSASLRFIFLISAITILLLLLCQDTPHTYVLLRDAERTAAGKPNPIQTPTCECTTHIYRHACYSYARPMPPSRYHSTFCLGTQARTPHQDT